MIFFKRSQEDLDKAFLSVVGKHRFRAAHKLLQKGANIHAVDEGGNGAFHKLAGYCPVDVGDMVLNLGFMTRLRNKVEIDAFICLLLDHKVDINRKNNKGETCLYHVIRANASEYIQSQMMGLLRSRGASIHELDHDGRSLLHIAASLNKPDLISDADLDRLWEIADDAGQYPHDYASKAGYHRLSQSLLNGMTKSLASRQQREERKEAPPVPVEEGENWHLLGEAEIAHQVVQKVLGYRITETFNFRTRIHSKIVFNLETKQDTVVDKSFDDYPDKAILERAYDQLIKCGGKAENSSIHGLIKKTVKT